MSQKIICVPRVGAVFVQMVATFSTSAWTLDAGKSGAVADSIRASSASLRPSVVIFSALSSRGSTFCDRSRGAGGEGDAVAGVLRVQEAGLHEGIERALAAAGLDARDALHLGRRFQVLVILGLVNEQVIGAQLVENQPIIFLVLGEQI